MVLSLLHYILQITSPICQWKFRLYRDSGYYTYHNKHGGAYITSNSYILSELHKISICRISITLSKMVAPIYIPTNGIQGPPSTPSTILVSYILDNSTLTYVRYCFNFHFPNHEIMDGFHVLLGHLWVLLEMSIFRCSAHVY